MFCDIPSPTLASIAISCLKNSKVHCHHMCNYCAMCLHALHGLSQHVSQYVIRSVRQLPLGAISNFDNLIIYFSIYKHASMAAVVVNDHT